MASALATILNFGVLSSAEAATDTEAQPNALVTFDGLGLLTGRYGLIGEVLVSSHDSLLLAPFYLRSESSGSHDFIEWPGGGDSTVHTVRTGAFGVGLHYRRYLGSDGPRGFFLSPGLDLSHFSTESVDCLTHPSSEYKDPAWTKCAGGGQSWSYLGASLDVGGQAVLPMGLVFGASIGVRGRGVIGGRLDESVLPFGWEVSNGSGIRPRARAWIGFAFL